MKEKRVGGFRLYLHYLSVIAKSAMQYKASFWMMAVGHFFVSFNVLAAVYFLFQRFSNVGGYVYSEVLLCFAVTLMEFSIAEIWARGFDTFPSMIRQGTFDRVLLRPRNEILQVLGSKFELVRIGRVLTAAAVFGYGVFQAGLRWTAGKVFALIFMLAGGVALFSALFLIYAALSFFTLEGLEFMNVFTNGAMEYGKYPFGVYGRKMLWITTFVIPYALVQHYPLQYLLDREDNPVLIFLPLAAMLFLVPAFCLWHFGVRKYKSSGS
ncbi:MAG: ABC-2 family transporter protein [bacterium]|nr:ABC-2 family transporter protein [bacterium]